MKMEEKIVKIIKKGMIPYQYINKTSFEIADIMIKFIEWSHWECHYEYIKNEGWYPTGDIISNKIAKPISTKELFDYWYDNIRDK